MQWRGAKKTDRTTKLSSGRRPVATAITSWGEPVRSHTAPTTVNELKRPARGRYPHLRFPRPATHRVLGLSAHQNAGAHRHCGSGHRLLRARAPRPQPFRPGRVGRHPRHRRVQTDHPARGGEAGVGMDEDVPGPIPDAVVAGGRAARCSTLSPKHGGSPSKARCPRIRSEDITPTLAVAVGCSC